MKTKSRPLRSSTASAVRTGVLASGDDANAAMRGPSGGQGRSGRLLLRVSRRRRGLHRRAPIGQVFARRKRDRPEGRTERRPPSHRAANGAAAGNRSGESPGIRKSRPRRVCQTSLSQPALACALQRCTGSTKPAGAPSRRSNARMMRERSIGSSIFGFSGSTFSGSSPSFCMRSSGSSNAGITNSGLMPSCAATPAMKRCASPGAGGAAGDLARDQRVVAPDRHAVACASRARMPSAAVLRRDTICPGRGAAARRAQSGRAGDGSVRRRGCAWSARARPYSIPPTGSRRPIRKSARRPW